MRRLAALIALAGCADYPYSVDEPACSRQTSMEIPLATVPTYDLLIVVDRSPSMAARLEPIAELLAELFVPPYSLHLAIATSDLGANVPGCETAHGGGLLGPRRDCTNAATDRVIIDETLADGSRRTNFAGTLADAIGCIAPTTASACPIEQPLEILRRLAADGIAPGFVRPEATLIIAILGDEDDCSLAAGGSVGWPRPDDDPETWSRWECFSRGVVCDQDRNSPGLKTGCRPLADSGELDVDAVIAAVRTLSTREVRVLVPGGEPVVVGRTTFGPDFVPVCAGEVDAWPAPRLQAFAAAFEADAIATSACDGQGGASALWGATSPGLRPVLGYPCIDDDIDLDPNAPGIQATCTAELRTYDATVSGFTSARVPACGDPPTTPCWRLVEDPVNCTTTPQHLGVEVDFGPTTPVPGRMLRLDCELACAPELPTVVGG